MSVPGTEFQDLTALSGNVLDSDEIIVVRGGVPYRGTGAQVFASTPNAQTDSYTLVLADARKTVTINKATAVNLTVPPNADVAFPIGTKIPVEQLGAGQITFVAGTGVTINSLAGNLKISGQYGAAVLTKHATNVWTLSGNLAA
jgi:hypothetical protein